MILSLFSSQCLVVESHQITAVMGVSLVMGVPLVIIHYLDGFSLTKTIQILIHNYWGTPMTSWKASDVWGITTTPSESDHRSGPGWASNS